MNIKLIHDNFVIDLVDSTFATVDENNWFNDKVFTKYTYPVAIYLTDEQIVAMKYVTEFNSKGVETVFDLVFEVLEVQHEALFEIEKNVGRKVTGQIRYGFEEFPNFDTKLAQLPLHKYALEGETIREHAVDRIDISFPDVDYNFPQVFTKKFDLDTEQWEAFEGVVNNYNNGAFVTNQYDVSLDKQYNRNVMQPMPYLLYVLQLGFSDAGYTLAGSILDDPEFKHACLNVLSSYYSTITAAGNQSIVIDTGDYISTGFNGYPEMGLFESEITIPAAGRYVLAGNLYLRSYDTFAFSYGRIYIDDVLVYDTGQSWGGYVLLDLAFELLPGQAPAVLRFESANQIFEEIGGTIVSDAVLLDISITQLVGYDLNGDAIPTLIAPGDIDLTKCVPDVTFGKLLEAVKKWKKYDSFIDGTTVYMNLVQQQIGKGVVVDLTGFEVKYPERKYNQARSIELKYMDIESEDYEFPSLLISAQGVEQSPYTKSLETEEIIIDAVALPLTTRNGVTTADGFLDDNGKIQLVLYNGLISGLNVCGDPAGLSLVNIHDVYYRDWFDFLLNSITITWEFEASDQLLRDLTSKSTPFAYGTYHVVREIIKKKDSNNTLRVEIELSSI